MDPSDIKLESIDRMFQYETQARCIDEMDHQTATQIAKCYLKLYLQQQEVILALGGLTEED